MFSEEIIEKSVECCKEVILYTPSGAAALASVTSFIPQEVTHLIFIFCCPLIVLFVKHEKRQHEEKAAKEEVVN